MASRPRSCCADVLGADADQHHLADVLAALALLGQAQGGLDGVFVERVHLPAGARQVELVAGELQLLLGVGDALDGDEDFQRVPPGDELAPEVACVNPRLNHVQLAAQLVASRSASSRRAQDLVVDVDKVDRGRLGLPVGAQLVHHRPGGVGRDPPRPGRCPCPAWRWSRCRGGRRRSAPRGWPGGRSRCRPSSPGSSMVGAWMTCLAHSWPALVTTAAPTAMGASDMASFWMVGPPLRDSAAATPPPMIPRELAGLTTASTAISVMSLFAMWITIDRRFRRRRVTGPHRNTSRAAPQAPGTHSRCAGPRPGLARGCC